EAARNARFDVVLFQDDAQYLEDQHVLLSPAQRRLPRIYLEHDPPQAHPTDTRHPADEHDVLVVHVTPFNALMWRHERAAARGVVVVNHLARRGRRLGADVFAQARRRVPLDLVGMGAEEACGLGEVRHAALPAFVARYRFFFNPIRYTSLGLAVIEAMMVGVPVVGLATTEMATAVVNGVGGYVDTDVHRLVEHMQRLVADPDEARRLGAAARAAARERFGIARFVRDWNAAFAAVA